MERLMNNVNIIRQECPLSLKDSRNRSHTASLKLKLDGQKTRADIWTKWQLKTGHTLSLGARDNDMRTTGSWLSTLRDLSHPLLGCSENRPRTCDSKMNNQAIIRYCRGTKLDRGHSKNAIKNNSGSGTRGQIHPPLHWHGHIAILVDHLKTRGLPLISIFFSKRSLARPRWLFPCHRREV